MEDVESTAFNAAQPPKSTSSRAQLQLEDVSLATGEAAVSEQQQLRQMAVQSDAAGGAELDGAAGGAASDAVQAGVDEDQADSTNEFGVAPGDGGDSAHE